jgi:phage shock protein PspC (stress-responsive transcriptional regulator)
MHSAQPSLFARDHTFFGVCEGLGEDFGFNPVYLRLTLAGLMFWNPVAVLAGYAGLGAVVLVSRLLIPDPRPATAAVGAVAAAGEAPVEANDAAEREPLALAA